MTPFACSESVDPELVGNGTTVDPTATPTCQGLNGGQIGTLTAPTNEGFAEAVIVSAGNEAAVAYTRWNENREVAVEVQRLTLNGEPIGAPIMVGNYEVSYGQLAAGGFYGGLTMATDGSRYMLCWSEAFQLGCAAIGVGSGDVSSSVLVIPDNQLVKFPHVAHGSAGWFIFSGFATSNYLAIALDNDAKAIGVPVAVPATNVVATTNGFAVASTADTITDKTSQVFRLGPDLKPVGAPIDIASATYGIASLGDALSVVGFWNETRISPSNQLKTTQVADLPSIHGMAVAPRGDTVGLAWSSPDGLIQFRCVDASSQASSVLHVTSAVWPSIPSITSTDAGFLVATLSPKGVHEIFYNQVSPTIDVTLIMVP